MDRQPVVLVAQRHRPLIVSERALGERGAGQRQRTGGDHEHGEGTGDSHSATPFSYVAHLSASSAGRRSVLGARACCAPRTVTPRIVNANTTVFTA